MVRKFFPIIFFDPHFCLLGHSRKEAEVEQQFIIVQKWIFSWFCRMFYLEASYFSWWTNLITLNSYLLAVAIFDLNNNSLNSMKLMNIKYFPKIQPFSIKNLIFKNQFQGLISFKIDSKQFKMSLETLFIFLYSFFAIKEI